MNSQKTFGFTIALLLALSACVLAAEPARPDPEFLDVPEASPQASDRSLQTYSGIRMRGNYDSLGSISAEYQAYIQNDLGPAVISFFQGALKVKYPITSTLSISKGSSSICGMKTPAELWSGVATDFYVFFDAETDTESSWVASSYACYLSSGSKRPLIAKTTFNTDLFGPPNGDVLLQEKNVYLLLHEMSHNFGFTSGMFKYFLDENGAVRKGHIKVRPLDGVNATVIDVPPLTTRLRNFFGCPSVEGAYLEASGSEATSGDHFERRHFVFEAMTSGLIYGLKYTEFSLAMLEGSGWYVPDYTYADPYTFGQGQGCNFLFGTCTDSSFVFDEFCKGSSKGCTQQGQGAGYCQSDIRSNGCKFYYPNKNYDCENDDASDNAVLPSAETYGRGLGSRCFTGTLTTKRAGSSNGYCFKYTCGGTPLNTTLTIQVGTKQAVCKAEGTVTVSGYNGVINCPDPLAYCSTIGKKACSKGCMGRGTCVNGQCVCNTGYKGTDCGHNV